MIVSFTKARQCARCKRPRKRVEQDWGAMLLSMDKGLLRWFKPRFAICPACLGEMLKLAEEGPDIDQLLGG